MSAQTKYAAMSRRAAMTAAAMAAMATLAGCNGGGTPTAAEGDMALGAAEGAKVTVIEYASVTCPHCATWQEQTWPAFKAAYVDTNKVRYVFRELPTPPANVAVAGFMIARCAGEDKYFDVIHGIMASQGEWRAGVNPRDTLFRIGNGAGLNNDQIDACITDPANLKASEERSEAAMKAGVNSTPAFFVNGVEVVTPGGEGASMADLSRAIEAELAKG
ncbi:DsbA family protein [Brevundimonas sp.]|uniref:DsbA family protein n=1 Tax=Brevundimonas sp. TaxID=1871086 RepID=UPI0012162F6A|nr:DsbA family protein [Brevundimonas sp.]TAJ62902.1 MAG: DsbA family protein [Brevundimonas sp.]